MLNGEYQHETLAKKSNALNLRWVIQITFFSALQSIDLIANEEHRKGVTEITMQKIYKKYNMKKIKHKRKFPAK